MVSFPGFPSLLKSPENSWRMIERTQRLEPGNQPCSSPTKHSNRAVSASTLCPAKSSRRSPGDCHSARHTLQYSGATCWSNWKWSEPGRWQLSLKQKFSSTFFLPSTRTQKSLMQSTLQQLSHFSCLGGLTRCTSGCLGLVSLLQPQQLNHLRNKEVQKQINSR